MLKLKNIAVLMLLTLFLLLAGCSSNKSAMMNTASFAGNGTQTQDTAGVTQDTTKSTASKSTASATNAQNNQRKIVKTADLDIETLTYDKSISGLEALVNRYNGYVESSDTEGQGLDSTDASRTATYTLRIPSDKLNGFLSSVGSIGSITNKTLKGEDVTQDYYDKESRLTALRIQQSNLLQMLKNADNLDDMIKINSSLTDVNTQIEELTGELQKTDSLVSLSTVNVTINEVVKITKASKKDDGFGAQVWNVFASSLNALLIFFQVLIKIIVAILPFAIVFGAIAIVIIAIVKFFTRKKKD